MMLRVSPILDSFSTLESKVSPFGVSSKMTSMAPISTLPIELELIPSYCEETACIVDFFEDDLVSTLTSHENWN